MLKFNLYLVKTTLKLEKFISINLLKFKKIYPIKNGRSSKPL